MFEESVGEETIQDEEGELDQCIAKYIELFKKYEQVYNLERSLVSEGQVETLKLLGLLREAVRQMTIKNTLKKR